MKPTERPLFDPISSQWREGRPSQAAGVIAEHPSVTEERSAILDDAYMKFRRLRDAGEKVELEEFCSNFPGHQSSVRNLLLADMMVEHFPSVGDEPPQHPSTWPVVGDF